MNAFLSSLGKYCLKFNPHGGIRTKETYTHHAANGLLLSYITHNNSTYTGIGHSDLPARCCRGGCTENDLKAMCIPPETPPRPTVTRQPPMMSESQLEEMLRLRVSVFSMTYYVKHVKYLCSKCFKRTCDSTRSLAQSSTWRNT